MPTQEDKPITSPPLRICLSDFICFDGLLGRAAYTPPQGCDKLINKLAHCQANTKIHGREYAKAIAMKSIDDAASTSLE